MFYEAQSDFFYDPKSTYYYGCKQKSYFRFCQWKNPPFEKVTQTSGTEAFASQSEAASRSESRHGTTSSAPEKDRKSLNFKAAAILSKPVRKSLNPAPKPPPKPVQKPALKPHHLKPAVQKADPPEKSRALRSKKRAGLSESKGKGEPTVSKPPITHAQRVQFANVERWNAMAASKQIVAAKNSKEAETKVGATVSKTSKGEPICLLCMRKFKTEALLDIHERKSKLHADNLEKQSIQPQGDRNVAKAQKPPSSKQKPQSSKKPTPVTDFMPLPPPRPAWLEPTFRILSAAPAGAIHTRKDQKSDEST